MQMVNEGYQVFNKTTGASVLGPNGISSIWSGFGGVCENDGDGDPVVLYDQLANRWLISQFAGASTFQPTSASPSPPPAMPPAVTIAMAFISARTSSITRTWASGPTPIT